MMKKIYLSLTVIILFSLYVLSTTSKINLGQLFSANLTNTSIRQSPVVTPEKTDNSQPLSPPPPALVPSTPGRYKNGEYIGSVENAYYGYVQIKIKISNGNLNTIQFLSYPNERQHSVSANQRAMPLLINEAIKAQSANVDIISGATDTSIAFQQSLKTALEQA